MDSDFSIQKDQNDGVPATPEDPMKRKFRYFPGYLHPQKVSATREASSDINCYLPPPARLPSSVSRLYLFDMSKLEAKELRIIQKTNVINWYNMYLRSSSPQCRQLDVHVWQQWQQA
ncbi:uncharacterized protein A4U43_C10F6740 [Asparagus officinalis]|uniref:Uncharacterized protein n=1 Tax=Asparagus officinalis TaxID=4686 RepID=A0A5P1E5P3_ASPOF|nr:uncharacterized protein A4U43_C10F6740 [Asparagus officinalis]